MTLDSLLDEYVAYLANVRGVALRTRGNHRRQVSRWVEFLARRGVFDPRHMRPTDADAFVERRRRRMARSTVAGVVAALRAFLRYLAFRGLVPPSLAQSVYGPRIYAMESLPRCLSPDELKRFFAAIDTTRPIGRRDYALFLLMLSTGLRVAETLALTLDDIDWKRRTLHVRNGKSGRSRVAPFPVEAGEALIRYLKSDRPAGLSTRAVFLGLRWAAARPLRAGASLWLRFRCYARGAGLVERAFPHALRHSFAQTLLESGADYATLQDLLGHATTRWISIYAKVSLRALREVADNYAEDL